MNASFALYPLEVIFAFLFVLLPSLLFFAAGALIRFLSKEKPLQLIGEGAWLLFGLLDIAGFLLLYAENEGLLSLILLYSPVLPLIFLQNPKENVLSLFDIAALLLFLPFLQLTKEFAIVSFLALLYLFARSVFSFALARERMFHSFTFYSLKEALDHFSQGLAIANRSGKWLYVNQAFLDFLSAFEIDPHQKEETIFLQLRWKSFRLVGERSLVLVDNGHYYLLREILKSSRREMTISMVDAEVSLNEKLAEVNAALQKGKTYLLATLDKMKAVAEHQEKEELRGLVHDSFAEEVSLIHQVLINPSVNDLSPLKALMRQGLANEKGRYSDLHEMEHFYSLLGVAFRQIGSWEECLDKALAIRLIQEASDNAIRHGNASAITLEFQKEEGRFHLSISNNGEMPEEVVPHNGLSHLQSLFAQKGGKLLIETSPVFALEAFFPLPKG